MFTTFSRQKRFPAQIQPHTHPGLTMAPSGAISSCTVPACVDFNLRCSSVVAPSKSYSSITLPMDIEFPTDTFHFNIFIGFKSCCDINTVFSAIFNGNRPLPLRQGAASLAAVCARFGFVYSFEYLLKF